MKKMWFVLCALLLVPTLALASGDMVSVSELRQQVEAMGRWTKTYEAYGRTIEVDVPIIVPEVDELPIVTVQAYNPYSETELFSCDHLKNVEKTTVESGNIKFLLFCKINPWQKAPEM